MYSIDDVIKDLKNQEFNIVQSKVFEEGKKIIRKVNKENVISIVSFDSGYIIYTEDGNGVIAHKDYLDKFIEIIEN